MELREALAKAAESPEAFGLGMNYLNGGLEVSPIHGVMSLGSSSQYMAPLKPLIAKWADLVGDASAKIATDLDRVGSRQTTDEEDDAALEQWEAMFRSTGADYVLGVFALGYLLGDPKWDKNTHNRENFESALKQDREIHKALHARFCGEDFLKEHYGDYLDRAAKHASAMFLLFNLSYTEENIHRWGKLTAEMVMYTAFSTGLKVRRIVEEDAAFLQIANMFEESE